MKRRWAVLFAVALPTLGSAGGFECLVEASQVVEIRPAVDGVIARVSVQRGELVRKGQVLVELDSAAERVAVESARYRSTMNGQVATAQNRLDSAVRKLARAEDLYRHNFTSAQARDDADAERRLAESELQVAVESRELAKIEYRRAVEQLALRTLTSPFNGVVVDRMLNPGDLAESGAGRKGVLKIAQIDPLRVDIVLPDSVFGQPKPGTKATVVLAGSNVRHSASVKLVDRLIDAASSTFVARLELPNPQHAISGGARCVAEIAGVEAPREARPRAQTQQRQGNPL
ncbi:MAG: efflux RND transporter periplasmic adaptor subunit [Burkholderiaceae bacterium]|jgi:RND family efflux transporter MFP subunit|nr:efflux RND transporter periplasmic adaptor subunit [Burkholderiaceae bacterium]